MNSNLEAVSPTNRPAREEAVAFFNARDEQLIGVWHDGAWSEAANNSHRDTAIVVLHGWSGYRTGPHQMLTRAAREFAAANYSILRFDFAGRGDSEGDTEFATLATMADDARAAVNWCIAEKGVSRVVLLGLCSGCEVALAAATANNVTALALWSAPVFAALETDEAETQKRKSQKRKHHLKEYARKLLRPSTYAKILGGKLDTKSIGKALSGGGGAAHKNIESGAVGQLPTGWRANTLNEFKKFDAPLLLIYGTGDPTTGEALAWHQALVEKRIKPQVHLIKGANHSYYGLGWESEVFAHTLNWLQKLPAHY